MRQLAETKPYDQLDQLAGELAAGLDDAARQAGIPHTVARQGSLLTLFFNEEPVTNYEIAVRSDTKQFATFFWKMLERGVYLPCSQFEALFVSTAHTREQIQQTIQAAHEALSEMRDG